MAHLTSSGVVLTPPDHQQDLADLQRLLAFVEQRRAQLAAAGQPTADAEALLAKLRLGLERTVECVGK